MSNYYSAVLVLRNTIEINNPLLENADRHKSKDWIAYKWESHNYKDINLVNLYKTLRLLSKHHYMLYIKGSATSSLI